MKDAKDKRSEEIEVIYKDLMYTTTSYFSGEQIYPLWEAVYALINAGFLAIFLRIKLRITK